MHVIQTDQCMWLNALISLHVIQTDQWRSVWITCKLNASDSNWSMKKKQKLNNLRAPEQWMIIGGCWLADWQADNWPTAYWQVVVWPTTLKPLAQVGIKPAGLTGCWLTYCWLAGNSEPFGSDLQAADWQAADCWLAGCPADLLQPLKPAANFSCLLSHAGISSMLRLTGWTQSIRNQPGDLFTAPTRLLPPAGGAVFRLWIIRINFNWMQIYT